MWRFLAFSPGCGLCEMLKWLGGGTSSAGASSNSSGNGTDNLTHVGKVFTVNEHQVVVEELIAEGLYISWPMCVY